MRVVRLVGKGAAVLTAAAAGWFMVFAATGSALLHPYPSAHVAIGRALLAGLLALLSAPALLESLPTAATSSFFKKFLIGLSFLIFPYIVTFLLMPTAHQAPGWFAYGIAVSIPGAALAARLIRSR